MQICCREEYLSSARRAPAVYGHALSPLPAPAAGLPRASGWPRWCGFVDGLSTVTSVPTAVVTAASNWGPPATDDRCFANCDDSSWRRDVVVAAIVVAWDMASGGESHEGGVEVEVVLGRSDASCDAAEPVLVAVPGSTGDLLLGPSP